MSKSIIGQPEINELIFAASGEIDYFEDDNIADKTIEDLLPDGFGQGEGIEIYFKRVDYFKKENK